MITATESTDRTATHARAAVIVSDASPALLQLWACGCYQGPEARRLPGVCRRLGLGYVATRASRCRTAEPLASWDPTDDLGRAVRLAAVDRRAAMRAAVDVACSRAGLYRWDVPKGEPGGETILARFVVPGTVIAVGGVPACVLAAEPIAARPDRVRLTIWIDNRPVARVVRLAALLPYREPATRAMMERLRARSRIARAVLACSPDGETTTAIRAWLADPLQHPSDLPRLLGDLYNADPARRAVCWSALRWCERLAAGRLDRLAHRFPEHVPSRVLAVADALIRQCTDAPFPRNGQPIVTVQHTVLLARAMAKRADHVQRITPQAGYSMATVYRGETYDGDRWAVVLQGGEP